MLALVRDFHLFSKSGWGVSSHDVESFSITQSEAPLSIMHAMLTIAGCVAEQSRHLDGEELCAIQPYSCHGGPTFTSTKPVECVSDVLVHGSTQSTQIT